MSQPDGDEVPTFFNIEAEAALLGALMIDNRLVTDTAHLISESFFFEPLHGRIYRMIKKFVTAGRVATPITLRPVFELDRDMKEIGGPAYLATLTGSGAALIGARDFAEQVRDLAMTRRVKRSVEQGIHDYGAEGEFSAFLAPIETALAEASTSIRAVEVLTMRQMVQLTRDRVEKAIEQGIPGAKNKLVPDVDTLIGPLEGGQMTILAGRPGMGKSTLALSSALGYSMNGHPGLYALCESSNEMFSLKLVADLLHAAGRPILFKNLKSGILTNQERRDVEKALEVADTLPCRFAHIGRTDIKRLEAIISREVNLLARVGKKLAYFIVDYLQLLTAEDRHKVGDDRGRVNAVSEAILTIAQKYDTHAIALSQLSRGVEQREDKRPRVSDLRESGRLEEDADNVLMVYREEYYLKDQKPKLEKDWPDWQIELANAKDKVELIAAKTRFGSNATRKCNFLGDYSAIRGSSWVGGDALADADDDLFSAFEERSPY